MAGIQVKVSGDTQKLLKKLKRFSEAEKKGIHRALAESLRTSTIERFKQGKSPEDKKWKKSIRASNEGKKTLIDRSVLRNSIRSTAKETGFAVGTNDIRAATHQFGDTRTIRAKSKPFLRFQFHGRWICKKEVTITIPARPFLGISVEDEAEIKTMLQDLYEG